MVVLEFGDVGGDNTVEQGYGSVDGAGRGYLAYEGALATLLIGEISVEHGALDAPSVCHEAIRQMAEGVEGADGADACTEVEGFFIGGEKLVDDAG